MGGLSAGFPADLGCRKVLRLRGPCSVLGAGAQEWDFALGSPTFL